MTAGGQSSTLPDPLPFNFDSKLDLSDPEYNHRPVWSDLQPQNVNLPDILLAGPASEPLESLSFDTAMETTFSQPCVNVSTPSSTTEGEILFYAPQVTQKSTTAQTPDLTLTKKPPTGPTIPNKATKSSSKLAPAKATTETRENKENKERLIQTTFSCTASARICLGNCVESPAACSCIEKWEELYKTYWHSSKFVIIPNKKRNQLVFEHQGNIYRLKYRVFTTSTFLKVKTKKYCVANKILGCISPIVHVKLKQDKDCDIVKEVDPEKESKCTSGNWDIAIRIDTKSVINKEPALMYRLACDDQDTGGLALVKDGVYTISVLFAEKPTSSCFTLRGSPVTNPNSQGTTSKKAEDPDCSFLFSNTELRQNATYANDDSCVEMLAAKRKAMRAAQKPKAMKNVKTTPSRPSTDADASTASTPKLNEHNEKVLQKGEKTPATSMAESLQRSCNIVTPKKRSCGTFDFSWGSCTASRKVPKRIQQEDAASEMASDVESNDDATNLNVAKIDKLEDDLLESSASKSELSIFKDVGGADVNYLHFDPKEEVVATGQALRLVENTPMKIDFDHQFSEMENITTAKLDGVYPTDAAPENVFSFNSGMWDSTLKVNKVFARNKTAFDGNEFCEDLDSKTLNWCKDVAWV